MNEQRWERFGAHDATRRRRGGGWYLFALALVLTALAVPPVAAQTPAPTGLSPVPSVAATAVAATATTATTAPTGGTPSPATTGTPARALPPADAQFVPTLAGEKLLDALKRGGYVIYFRHGSTDQSRQDMLPIPNYLDCGTQRNLSDAGRQESRTIGQSFRTLSIPVGKVLSSEFCRTREMAQLMFDRFDSEPALTYTKEMNDNYFSLLSTRPEPGMNTVLVGHVPGISSATGFSPNEGEAGVFDPAEPGNPRFVARVPASEWIRLLPPNVPIASGTPPMLLSGQPLLDTLKRGGYVIYFRHAATNFDTVDQNVVIGNCATQRNLNEQGRADSRTIGQSFRTLGIPVGRVGSSEYCRDREMGELAFGRYEDEPVITLNNENPANYIRLLSTRPEPGVNTVLLGHVPGISSATGFSPNEGEAGIFDPTEPGNPRFVARILPNDWIKLVPPVGATVGAVPPPLLDSRPLADALRQGGYVIYFRHGSTDQSRQDGTITDYNDCTMNQRLLNEAGRMESREIGRQYTAMRLPVGEVLSSEFCRTREMATLMFGRLEIEPALSFTKENRDNYLRLLTTRPAPGTNTVLVGHVPGISGATGLVLSEGEAAIFDPTEPNNPRFVARVLAYDWAKMANP